MDYTQVPLWNNAFQGGILRIKRRKITPFGQKSLKFLAFPGGLPLNHQIYLGRSRRPEAKSVHSDKALLYFRQGKWLIIEQSVQVSQETDFKNLYEKG